MPARRRPLARRLLTLALLAACLAAAPWRAGAQDAPADTTNVDREARLKAHEERVKAILEERRKQRLQETPVATDGQPPAPAAPAATPAPQEPAAQDNLQLIGTVMLYTRFRPVNGPDSRRELDTAVRVGDRFLGEVVLKNDDGRPFDRVRVALRFDKRFMRPVRVFDAEVRPYVDGDPVFEISDRDNIIVYDARLAEPRQSKQLTVLTIVWEAVQRTEFAGLDFRFASGDTELAPHTAVYAEGRNILGKPDDPIDGVLGSSVLVSRREPVESTSARAEILQGKKEELKEMYLGALGAEMNHTGIRLAGPEGPIAAGQMFDVDVELYNPRGTVLDQVRFAVKFDPEVLQVVDRDRGNWIRTGVNVHDGPFRLEYPFDYHKRNEVDNRRGIITYANSMGEGRALRSGPFARIRFKAMKPVADTRIELIAQRQGAGFLTATDYFGFPMLSFDKAFTQPELSWTISPPDADALPLIERPKPFVPVASSGAPAPISYPSPAELPVWYRDPEVARPGTP